jgi:hypothetical protein
MALTYPDLLPGIFAAGSSNHDEIPDTNADDGRMAWDVGFPSETSQPIVAGGVPPRRLDMNGLGNRLSQHIFFQQSGGLYVWSADLDYPAGAHILGSNGVEYIAVAASGPSATGGAVDPTTDVNFSRWKSYQRSLVDIIYPVGSIYMSANNVNPGTLFGGTWQAISGRFILAAGGNYPLGSTGGSATKQLSVNEMPAHTHVAATADAGGHIHTATNANNGAHTHSISITNGAQSAGAHTHGVTYAAQGISATTGSAGAHTHGVPSSKTTLTTGSAGAHTHTRGTMNIEASGFMGEQSGTSGDSFAKFKAQATGALYYGSSKKWGSDGGLDQDNYTGYFDASRPGAWTGHTSSDGSHTHSITINANTMTAGSNGAHTHGISFTIPAQGMTTGSAGAHTHNISGTTASAGSHTHAITVQTAGVHQHNVTVNQAGGNASFNIIPPYIAVNVWKRTA